MRSAGLASQPILELVDVSYTYEGEALPVWQHLSLCVFPGQIHAISGPSGCGKSSLLGLMNGIIPHLMQGNLEGKVLLDGVEATDVKPAYRCEDIGLVMQNPESQFVTFTVEDELAFGMENLGIEFAEMDRRINEMLELAGLTELRKCSLDQLSGGQKQKVAIASVLVTQPRILLLDEPTANLDPEARASVFELLERAAFEQGVAVVLVEHNLREIIDRIAWLYVLDASGKLIYGGPATEASQSQLQGVLPADSLSLERKFTDPPLAGEVLLELRDIHFAYPVPGERRKLGPKVLDGVSLQLRQQEFVAIVGKNGVGKSTLLRLILGILKPQTGTIDLRGRSLNSFKPKEIFDLMGLVFQNPEDQFISNSVKEEMIFSLKRSNLSEQEKEERVMSMLARFALDGLCDKSPFALSQGQKRRLSVASMLLTNQEILFLDEPTYGQDFENRQELMADMVQLVRDGITVVMITHDLDLVSQYATRVIDLSEGSVRFDLPVADYFRARSENRLDAGSMDERPSEELAVPDFRDPKEEG